MYLKGGSMLTLILIISIINLLLTLYMLGSGKK